MTAAEYRRIMKGKRLILNMQLGNITISNAQGWKIIDAAQSAGWEVKLSEAFAKSNIMILYVTEKY